MPPKKRKSSSSNNGTGTGYGGGGQGDTKRLLAGRKKAEKEATKEDWQRTKYLRQAKLAIERSLSKANDLDTIDEIINERERTRIVKDLADIFRNQVPTDWDSRKDLYNAAFALCRTLATDVRLGIMFGDRDDPEGVLFWLVDFSTQAEQIMKRGAAADVVIWTDEDNGDMMMATQVSEVKDAAVKISRLCQTKEKPVEELSVVSLSERYQSELGSLRFATVESMTNHSFLKKIATAPAGLNTRVLFKELTAYRTALPVEYGSSCFCRVIDSRLDMLRVLITGPDETPYANGCFLFDVNLPASYPQVAPKVQFLTTGGGRIRFNPNLYNCGKVCLSLLGTWQGPGWVSGESTLLQVLISIQSLILVPDPYYNEPGWERERGTPRGKTNSDNYNRTIRRYTLDAAIESPLSSILTRNSPYPEFEPVLIRHFLEKRTLIEREIRNWAAEDASLSTRVDSICNLLAQLAQRERAAKREASRAKRAGAFGAASGAAAAIKTSTAAAAAAASSSNETIVLDSDDADDTPAYAKSSASSTKENQAKAIEIDSDDDGDDGGKKPAAVEMKQQETKGGNDDGGVIDLT